MTRPDPTPAPSLPDDESLLDKVARLARLRLTPEERALLAPQFRRMVDYVSLLEAAAGGAGEETGEAGGAGALREDDVRPSLPRGLLLGEAPRARDGFLEVPPVLDGEEA